MYRLDGVCRKVGLGETWLVLTNEVRVVSLREKADTYARLALMRCKAPVYLMTEARWRCRDVEVFLTSSASLPDVLAWSQTSIIT